MARVTVEDCVEQVPNRFELVLLAAQRARDISAGSELTVDRDNDKNPVVALREIADTTVRIPALSDAIVQGLQKHVEVDEPEEDEFDSMVGNIVTEMGGVMVADDVGEDSMLSIDEAPEEGSAAADLDEE